VPLLRLASGGVADAVFWGGGIAVLTEHNHVIVTTNIEAADPHPCELADPRVGDEEQVYLFAYLIFGELSLACFTFNGNSVLSHQGSANFS
jgi:hypothetical protein